MSLRKDRSLICPLNVEAWRVNMGTRLAWIILGVLLAGCTKDERHGWQGYFEGEFVYVAAPLAGKVAKVSVTKGERVAKGAALFALEVTSELAAQKEAAERLRQAEAKLADLKKGQRPTEIAALEAKLEQAKTAKALAERQVERVTKLFSSKSISEDDVDKATSTRDTTIKQIAEVEAQIATAKLGGRADAITAAEADVAAAKAALERADWSVNQKTQAAPADALVYDTLYREGEFAPAGSPVVALLPPDHLKVRFFLPEAEVAALKTGDQVKVSVTGRDAPIVARVIYLSPKPEYTPPVLYNRENRSKLVFMIEALPVDAKAARDLHPGQPVDVTR